MKTLTAKEKRAVRAILKEQRGKLVSVSTCVQLTGLTTGQVRKFLREHDEAYVQLQRWADGGLSTFMIADLLGFSEAGQVSAFLRHASPQLRQQFALLGEPERKRRMKESQLAHKERDIPQPGDMVKRKAAVPEADREWRSLNRLMVPHYEDHPGLQRSTSRPLY